MNAAVGSIAIVSFLLVCAVKKRKMKMSQLMDALSDPYFKPTKQLTIKDEVFISMLECCQNKGPCYVITDPSLRGDSLLFQLFDVSPVIDSVSSPISFQIIRSSTLARALHSIQDMPKRRWKDEIADFYRVKTHVH